MRSIQTMSKQRGMGLIGNVMLISLIIFFATVLVRLGPTYVDNWSLDRVLSSLAEEAAAKEMTPFEVREKMQRLFITNRIETLSTKEIKINREKRKLVIDARYEKRVPLMANIDAVVRFEEMVYEIEQ